MKQKAVESFTFDQLIGELKRIGLAVIKPGTLKAMNEQRVLSSTTRNSQNQQQSSSIMKRLY